MSIPVDGTYRGKLQSQETGGTECISIWKRWRKRIIQKEKSTETPNDKES